MNYYNIENVNNVNEFVTLVNKTRLLNKNSWYVLTGTINGKKIEIKGFKTWLQIFRINGIDNSNCPDQKISRFKEYLTSTFNNVITKV